MNIIQIGCNRGNDHITRLVRQDPSQITNLILVDALPACIEKAKECYKDLVPHALYYQLCMVTDDRGSVEIFHPTEETFGGDSSELASVNIDHLIKHNVRSENINKIVVPALHINRFLSWFAIPIDRLYIDTEGLDCDLIMALHLQELNIKYINWETSHSDGAHTKGQKCEDTYAFLEKNGYRINKFENEAEAYRLWI